MKLCWGFPSGFATAIVVVLAVIFPPTIPDAHAQSADADQAPRAPTHATWVNLGVGASAPEGEFVGGGIALSVARGERYLISARGLHLLEFMGTLSSTDPDYIMDMGVLYGVLGKSRRAFASASAGVGLASTKLATYDPSLGDYRSESFLTPSIPVEVQVGLKPTSVLGLGVYGFADVNSKHSFAGLLVCLQIGHLP